MTPGRREVAHPILNRIIEIGHVDDPGVLPQRLLSLAREVSGAAEAALVMGKGKRSSIVMMQPPSPGGVEDASLKRAVQQAEASSALSFHDGVLAAPLIARGQWLGTLVLRFAGGQRPPEGPDDVISLLTRMGSLAIDEARVRMAEEREHRHLQTELSTLEDMNARLQDSLRSQQARLDDLQRREAPRYGVERLAGQSIRVGKARKTIERVADTPLSVLIRGEVGTGRDLAARLCHRLSGRGQEPLVVVACAAIPEPLAQTELFGHVAGAFSGAQADRQGLLRQAHGGSVYFDNIEHLSPTVQALLLRVLQERSVLPVGADRAVPLDARFLASAGPDIEDRTRDGRFRADLYHRLNGVVIDLPPLRERLEDLPDLVRSVLTRAAGQEATMEDGALRILGGYDWPGNVRELANEIRKAVLASAGGRIGPAHLSPRLMGAHDAVTADEGPIRDLRDAVRDYIRQVHQRAGENYAQTARWLGIARNTVLAHLRDEPPSS